jgi:peptide/nickel transport system ATP-binding protein
MSDETALLRIEGLRLRSGTGAPLVDGVSFDIHAGEMVAVVGESGSGKSLTARAILNLLPPGVEIAGGAIRFQGRDLLTLAREPLRAVRGARIGMVFQEPLVSLNPAIRIGEQMAEGLRLHTTFDAAEIRARSIEMLARVRVARPERCLDAYPHQFSGGMRQRIMLASVMLLKPALLLADEPTTALDMLVQREVLDVMGELAAEMGTAVLLISHDLALVAERARRVVVMNKGRVVEQGEAGDILLRPQQAYTRQLLAALPARGPVREPAQSAPLVELEQLRVSFPGARRGFRRAPPVEAVKGVSLQLHAGETLAVVGESGSGKTTVARVMTQLIQPSGGTLRFEGRDVAAFGKAERMRFQRAVQMVFQDPYSSLDPRMRLDAIVAEPLRHDPELTGSQRLQKARALLAEVGLPSEFASRFPHQISGGQRQRVAIARAVIPNPRVVVADEPVSALDATVQKQVLELLQRLQQRYGFALLFVSHDLGVVESVADRVAVMHLGHLIECGTRDAVFDRPHHPYTRALLSAAPALVPEAGGFRLQRREAANKTMPQGFAAFDSATAPGDVPEWLEVGLGHRVAAGVL